MSDWKFLEKILKSFFFKYLPNFILRCLKRSAKASNSLGSVSWSGWRLAAATAAAIAEWCEPEKWQFEKSLHNVKIFQRELFIILKEDFSVKWSHQVCVHSMDRHDDDDSSCGSYCGKIRAAGGVMMILASQTLVLTLSLSQLDLPSGRGFPFRASETYFLSK